MVKTLTEPQDEANSLNKPKADMESVGGELEFVTRLLGAAPILSTSSSGLAYSMTNMIVHNL